MLLPVEAGAGVVVPRAAHETIVVGLLTGKIVSIEVWTSTFSMKMTSKRVFHVEKFLKFVKICWEIVQKYVE